MTISEEYQAWEYLEHLLPTNATGVEKNALELVKAHLDDIEALMDEGRKRMAH